MQISQDVLDFLQVQISTVQPFWDATLTVLGRLADVRQ